MKEMLNVYRVTVTFNSVKPSLHELWEEIRKLNQVLTYVDIVNVDKFEVEKNIAIRKEQVAWRYFDKF